MPTFLFRGYDRQERRLYGSLFSPTLARAEEMSARKGAPVTLYESETRFKRREWSRIDPSELAYACRETGAVLDSGALLSEELPLIAKNIKDEQLRLTLTEIGALTARGIAPAGAFSMFGHVFGVFFVHVINSAKAGTPLAETMRSLSVYYEGEARAGEKFKRIFLYPMGRMLLAWNIAFWMTASLIPVANLLLPDAAGAAFETVRGLYSRGWALAAATVFVIAALIMLPRFPAVRRYTDSRLVRGRLLRKVSVPWYAGRIARGLGVLFKNKSAYAPVSDEWLRAAVHNLYLEEKIREANTRLRSGNKKLSVSDAALSCAQALSPEFYSIVAEAVEADREEEMAGNAAAAFAGESERALSKAAAVAVPMLFILTALTALLPFAMMVLYRR